MIRKGRMLEEFLERDTGNKVVGSKLVIVRNEQNQYSLWNPHRRRATVRRGGTIRMLSDLTTIEVPHLLSLIRSPMLSAINVYPYSRETSPGYHTIQTHSTWTPRIQ